MSACTPSASLTVIGVVRGRLAVSVGGLSMGAFRLPSDSIGNTTVTFSGVNINSEIRIYLPDGTEVVGIENCAADQVLTWPVYSSGSANNVVTIRIVNILYKIKEFNYTSVLGFQSIPLQQELDSWYKNPI